MEKKIRLKIAFLDILTDDIVAKRIINSDIFGGECYSESMRKMFGISKSEWFTFDATLGNFPESIDNFDAIIIAGSTKDPVSGKETKWMKDTYKFIKKATNKKIPILGTCGGLEFVTRALGKKIVINPKGREFGTIKIGLNRDGRKDLLFKGIMTDPVVYLSHEYMVNNIEDTDWKVLASSKLCDIQTIAIGDTIRLTQFHPEMRTSEIKSLGRMRKEILLKEKFFNDEKAFNKFIKSIQNNEKIGKQILNNFLTYFVLPYNKKKGFKNIK